MSKLTLAPKNRQLSAPCIRLVAVCGVPIISASGWPNLSTGRLRDGVFIVLSNSGLRIAIHSGRHFLEVECSPLKYTFLIAHGVPGKSRGLCDRSLS